MKVNAAYIIPSPTQILTRLWELRVPLFTVHLPATMLVTAVGLLISLLLGLTLAVVMDAFPLARKSLYPIIIASQTIPTTAIAPLFVLWFGYGIWSKVLVTVLITFFPIVITVYDGFQSAKTEMEELLCTYGATRIQIFCKLKIPTALPYFFSAIKMAIPMSIIVARRSKRSWLLLPPDDDPARRRRSLCTHCSALGGGDAARRSGRAGGTSGDPLARGTVKRLESEKFDRNIRNVDFIFPKQRFRSVSKSLPAPFCMQLRPLLLPSGIV